MRATDVCWRAKWRWWRATATWARVLSALRGQGARVIVTEIDPICALQAAMEGYAVMRMDDAVPGDIFITATGCCHVLTERHMRRMKHYGHCLQHRPLRCRDRNRKAPEIPVEFRQTQVDIVTFPMAGALLCWPKGRLVNLGCATGHPSFVMSNSFTNQVLAQIELFTHAENISAGCLCAAKWLDEKSPDCTWPSWCPARIADSEAAAYLGIPAKAPSRPIVSLLIFPPKDLCAF